MRYYEWTANSEGNCIVWHIQSFHWKDDFELSWRLMEGRLFGETEWNIKAVAYWDEERPLTDLPFNPNIPFHSARLKVLLEGLGLGSDIQYLPIRLIGEKSGREVGVYYVANFLRRVPCLDLEHSIGVEFFGPDWIRPEQRGKLAGVFKAALKKEAIGDARLFRVEEWEYIVVVREDVKQAIEAAGITGCWFWELEVV